MDDHSKDSSAMGTLSPYFKNRREGSPSHDLENRRAPLLMQRQKSSAIDVTAFSFAKHTAHQGAFSLRALPKQSLVNTSFGRNARLSERHKETQAAEETPLVAKDGYVIIVSRTTTVLTLCL